MDKQAIINAVIVILKNLSDNEEALQHQLISANELLASVIIEGATNMICSHPKENRINMSCMGDDKKTEKCLICNEILVSEW